MQVSKREKNCIFSFDQHPSLGTPPWKGREFSGCLLHLVADKLEPAVKPGQAALSLAGMSDAQPSIR